MTLNEKALSNIIRDMHKENQQQRAENQAARIADIKQRIGIPDVPISLTKIMNEVIKKNEE